MPNNLELELFHQYPYPTFVEDEKMANQHWPNPAQIWELKLNPAPDGVFDDETFNLSKSFNPKMVTGGWVSLDSAVGWSEKRGSPQPKNLNCDSLKAYNKNMQKYLSSYLIKQDLQYNRTGAKNISYWHIFLATSFFTTGGNKYHPVFIKLSFRDIAVWRDSIKTIYTDSAEQLLLELKCYVSGRRSKIGLFTQADSITMLGYNEWQKGHRVKSVLDSWNTGNGDVMVTHATQGVRNNWHDLASGNTLTTRKKRNQIYLWVNQEDLINKHPTKQLGLFNWRGDFSNHKSYK